MKGHLSKQTLKRLDFRKEELKHEGFKKEQFKDSEIHLLKSYAKDLGYHFSINSQGRTIKLFNEKNFRSGFVRKINGKIWYGYIKDGIFNSTAIINNNLKLYCSLNNFEMDKNSLLKIVTGISNLEFNYDKLY